ncbi:hypothetical protein pv_317 [Pithovirus sibericum]|uniref:Uncharacterized protein n=1 Tax=Pithovirus sibericum TaxID=1450746 RepID=W5S5E2_9VIRU|nr:hypothetical protein pv_317 [Pithovirus sibericum]AHH01884.1 hypothetical protein pv_317 [Pithovirus sibericum]
MNPPSYPGATVVVLPSSYYYIVSPIYTDFDGPDYPNVISSPTSPSPAPEKKDDSLKK